MPSWAGFVQQSPTKLDMRLVVATHMTMTIHMYLLPRIAEEPLTAVMHKILAANVLLLLAA